ncbi:MULTISPECIES: phage/plasmid replication protein, II/X family [Enterobacteriaceae]
MKEMLPHNTFYRHRRELLSFGIDINFYCDSPDSNNVVPLIRTLEAKPAEIPYGFMRKVLFSITTVFRTPVAGIKGK